MSCSKKRPLEDKQLPAAKRAASIIDVVADRDASYFSVIPHDILVCLEPFLCTVPRYIPVPDAIAVSAVCVHPNGGYVVMTTLDCGSRLLHVTATGRITVLRTQQGINQCTKLHVLPNGHLLEHRIFTREVVEFDGNTPVRTYEDVPAWATLSPDASSLYFVGALRATPNFTTLCRLDLATGALHGVAGDARSWERYQVSFLSTGEAAVAENIDLWQQVHIIDLQSRLPMCDFPVCNRVPSELSRKMLVDNRDRLLLLVLTAYDLTLGMYDPYTGVMLDIINVGAMCGFKSTWRAVHSVCVNANNELVFVDNCNAGLHIFLLPEPRKITVRVQTLGGSITEHSVRPSDTVAVLKELVESTKGIPYGQQRLVFKGKALADEKRLMAYAIQDGDTLILVEASRGD